MFVTTKRREIAGASELITYLDRRWVNEALQEVFGSAFEAGWRVEERPAELLETGAAMAKVLVRSEDDARRLVTAVTSRALREAPGLEVCGVISSGFEWAGPSGLHQALVECAECLPVVRTALPGPDARFPRIPVVDSCRATGLPAAQLLRLPDGSLEARSAESAAKWRAYGRQSEGDGLRRMAELAGTRSASLAQVVDFLNDRAEWIGTVYADGNSLGQVFDSFEQCVTGESNRAYADTFRDFSAALQQCTRQAFLRAVAELEELGAARDLGVVPVAPLVLGGDDMVALCAGRWALPFAEAYLRAFESLTAETGAVAGPLRRIAGQKEKAGLSACAGVAVAKTHFPFVDAQQLAYALLREAKQVKEKVPGPSSALSFHVLYDSKQTELRQLRAQSTVPGTPRGSADEGQTLLVAQPYVVGPPRPGVPWARGRHWTDLLARVAALTARGEDGERMLPASQMHALREVLFSRPDVADARFATVRGRYGDRGLDAVAGEDGSLFWPSEPDGPWMTGLLDAMDAVGFVPEALLPNAGRSVAGS